MNDKMNGPFGHVGNAMVVGDITNCWKTSNTMLPEDYRLNNENGAILFRTSDDIFLFRRYMEKEKQ